LRRPLDHMDAPVHTVVVHPHGYIPWAPLGLRPWGLLRFWGQCEPCGSPCGRLQPPPLADLRPRASRPAPAVRSRRTSLSAAARWNTVPLSRRTMVSGPAPRSFSSLAWDRSRDSRRPRISAASCAGAPPRPPPRPTGSAGLDPLALVDSWAVPVRVLLSTPRCHYRDTPAAQRPAAPLCARCRALRELSWYPLDVTP